jgi:ABC-type metal ion transport system substrate-binding protein
MKKEQWEKLEQGMFVFSKSGTKREILKVSKINGKTKCITLKAVRKTTYGEPNTVLCQNDCHAYFLEDRSKEWKELNKKLQNL